MFKALLALALPLLAQAGENAPWDIADSWSCAMDRLEVCEGAAGACRTSRDPAFFMIDFANAKFWVRDIDKLIAQSAAAQTRDWRETIVSRRFDPGDHIGRASTITLDNGDFLTIGIDPGKDGANDALLTRKDGASKYLFHGTCRPDPKAP